MALLSCKALMAAAMAAANEIPIVPHPVPNINLRAQNRAADAVKIPQPANRGAPRLETEKPEIRNSISK